jgi:hypothetical protein
LLQTLHVDLAHLEHGLHDPVGHFWICVLQHRDEDGAERLESASSGILEGDDGAPYSRNISHQFDPGSPVVLARDLRCNAMARRLGGRGKTRRQP